MELVYLWVEEYKNIYRQGFNFSPRFECKYDESSNKLTITENENYVSIFPENINITAIVGENGSGKSSLLDYISSLDRTNPSGIILYLKDNQYFCFYEKQKPTLLKPTNLDIHLISSFDYTNDNHKYYLNYNSLPIASSKSKKLKHGDNLDFIYLDGIKVPIQPSVDNMHENIFFVPRYISSVLNNDNILNNISSFLRFNRLRLILKPSSISSLKKYNKELSMPNNIFDKKFFDNTTNIRNKIIDTLSSIEKLHQKQFTSNQKIDYACFDLSLLIAFIEFYLINTTNSGNDLQLYDTMNNKILHLLEKQKREIEEGINEIKPDNPSRFFIEKWHKSNGYIRGFFEEIKKINELHKYLEASSSSKDKDKDENKGSRFSIDEILETLKFYYSYWNKENNFYKNRYIDIPIDLKLKENIKRIIIFQKIFTNEIMINHYTNGYLQVFDLDLYDSNIDIQYDEISDGEKQLIQYSIDIISVFNYYETRNDWNISITCLGDEIDNHLHPKWKQEIIYNFINMIKTYKKYTGKAIPLHIILTTHSPFVLSDLPKENIIFLDKYTKEDKEVENGIQKIGNCKNVSNNIDINQTFGANIHTLLSHGFFMKDGLMGEFAKGKINEVIELLNSKRKLSKKNQKFCENIISIIGEPILQKTLEHQLSGKLNPNETELQKLEREQKEIQAKIDKLKGNQ